MLVRMRVEDLAIGMYVQELDRPWTSTRFPFQGFVIRTDEEVAELRRCCRHVVVDDLKSRHTEAVTRRLDDALHPRLYRSPLRDMSFERWDGEERLKRTLRDLNRLRDKTGGDINDFYTVAARKYRVDPNRVSLIAADIFRALESEPKIGKWVALMQTRNDGLAEHARNVAVLAMGFARHLGSPEHLVTLIGEGALLHDIGLARIPSYVLQPGGEFQAQEQRLIRLHPSYARSCLQSYMQIPQEMTDIVELHHLRLDGSGYPQPAPREVPDHVYLVAVCDLFEEMTSYRGEIPLSPEEALIELDRMAGRQLPAQLVQQFVAYLGIYPRGNFVILANGAIGVVVSTHTAHRTRPVLRMLRGPDGTAAGQEYIDLAMMDREEMEAGWRIVRSVHPLKLGVDVSTLEGARA